MTLTPENTAIVLDSTSDFPEAHDRFANWRMVPLYVRFGEESRRERRFVAWSEEFLADVESGDSADPVRLAVIDTVRRWDIPVSHFRDFLDSMRMDLSVTEYDTYEELTRYTDKTIVERERLRAELDVVRERGYGLSIGEMERTSAMLSKPKPTSSFGKSAVSNWTRSRSYTVRRYSSRLSRRAVTRPGFFSSVQSIFVSC